MDLNGKCVLLGVSGGIARPRPLKAIDKQKGSDF